MPKAPRPDRQRHRVCPCRSCTLNPSVGLQTYATIRNHLRNDRLHAQQDPGTTLSGPGDEDDPGPRREPPPLALAANDAANAARMDPNHEAHVQTTHEATETSCERSSPVADEKTSGDIQQLDTSVPENGLANSQSGLEPLDEGGEDISDHGYIGLASRGQTPTGDNFDDNYELDLPEENLSFRHSRTPSPSFSEAEAMPPNYHARASRSPSPTHSDTSLELDITDDPLYAGAEDIFDDIHASKGLDCFSTAPTYGSPPAFSEDPILRAAYIQAFVAASVHGATHDMVQYMLQGSFETISSMSRRIPYDIPGLDKMARTLRTVERRLGVDPDQYIIYYFVCNVCWFRHHPSELYMLNHPNALKMNVPACYTGQKS
ncbi:hypothetical protein A0H81_13641 [Grifola frondosa]|uniref:Uncharacterized protein n=1 Tax=Grifola frondosa TaxID=5627 RepID=A0A1C7LNV2_GRIFR|nr:hypothetical protein A0H81_13641 [Grifola frondosa]